MQLLIGSLLWLLAGGNGVLGRTDLDKAFQGYWKEKLPKGRHKAARKILVASTDFDVLWQRLETGHPHDGAVEKGRFVKTRASRDLRFHYTLMVPESYDPARRYPLHVFLHGGVGHGEWQANGEWWRNYERMVNPDRIAVFPSSWSESMWWERSQVHNINAILDRLKSEYNIDENRVYLVGISDGGTGAYFQAARNTTPWAAILPYIGHASVLANPRSRTDGDFFLVNLANKPLYVVNTENDRLYPTADVEPYINLYRAAGARITFRAKAGYGHGMAWFPEEADAIGQFIATHSRNPYPDRIVWETETTHYNRAHWLIIEKLGSVAGEARFDSFNEAGGRLIFRRSGTSGRVELTRLDNTIRLKTQGVRRFTLLLSPKHLDFQRQIQVFANDKLAFQGRLTPDPKVLLKWAAKDNDRTMLFAAELTLEVK